MTMTALRAALALALLAAPLAAHADDDDDDGPKLGAAGLLSRANKHELPPILLSSGMPLAEAELHLKSGGYYELTIEADGSAEMAIAGAGFFRAIWIDEVVINKIEVRPLGLDSLEFDDEGEAEIGFVAIRPGSYELHVPGGGESQRLRVVIE